MTDVVPTAIVTVQLSGEHRECDLEVPRHVPAEDLIEFVATALGWKEAGVPCRFTLETRYPEGRLAPSATLADSGIWDGSILIVHTNAPGTPVEGFGEQAVRWHPLFGAGQGGVSEGYRWKRLDEE